MSDFDKLPKKKKSRFGELPNHEDIRNNFESPEIAPVKIKIKTNRVEPLNFKTTKAFKKEFKRVALLQDKLLVDLLEDCFTLYKITNNIDL